VPELGLSFPHGSAVSLTSVIWHEFGAYQYPLSVNSWSSGRSSIVVLSHHTGQIIGSFPIDFVRQSGNDSWQYILWDLAQLVESTLKEIVELKSEAGQVIDIHSMVHGGSPIIMTVVSLVYLKAGVCSHCCLIR
jgi:hypothetical protein